MKKAAPYLDQVILLVNRLERVSVDSIWARRASGLRGALLRWIEAYPPDDDQSEISEAEAEHLSQLIAAGFRFLERAARERLR